MRSSASRDFFEARVAGDSLIVVADLGPAGRELYRVRLAPLVSPRDYDRSGFVDQADYGTWSTAYGSQQGVGLNADGNGDGVVDAADYTVWRDSFPQPIVRGGDYDNSGSVGATDYDYWKFFYGHTSGFGLQSDGNGDGVVSAADYTVWRDNLVGPTTPPGDYDRSGAVGRQDHAVWAAQYGSTSGFGLVADGNGDGVVNAADYTVWRDNLVVSAPSDGEAAAVAFASFAPIPATEVESPSAAASVATPLGASRATEPTVFERRAFAPPRRNDLLLIDPAPIAAARSESSSASERAITHDGEEQTIARRAAIDEALAAFAVSDETVAR
jgi:hypothetical protein